MPIERTWDLLNVKYVITWRQELYLPSTIIYQEPAEDGTTYVHRLTEVGPRAWLVTQAQIADDAIILQQIADPNFNRWQIALLEPGSEPFIQQINQSKEPKKLSQTKEITQSPVTINNSQFAVHNSSFPTPAHLIHHLTTPAPALLVLSETYYPGWQATLDGQPVPLLRADYVLRAVPVPAGEHTVELIFRPLTFTVGAIISAITIIALAVILIMTRPQKIQPHRAPGSEVTNL